jgi:Mn2+/Fe2+ NRAMP family transporter
VAQTFGWKGTLDAPLRDARPFYAVMLGSLALAAVFALAGVPPIALLYGASIAAGIAGPVTLFFTVLIARDEQAMGAQRIGPGLAAAGWIVTAIVTFASIAYITLQTGGAKG